MNTAPNSLSRLKHNALHALTGTYSFNRTHAFMHFMRMLTTQKKIQPPHKGGALTPLEKLNTIHTQHPPTEKNRK